MRQSKKQGNPITTARKLAANRLQEFQLTCSSGDQVADLLQAFQLLFVLARKYSNERSPAATHRGSKEHVTVAANYRSTSIRFVRRSAKLRRTALHKNNPTCLSQLVCFQVIVINVHCKLLIACFIALVMPALC
jgi:hypothetical protein